MLPKKKKKKGNNDTGFLMHLVFYIHASQLQVSYLQVNFYLASVIPYLTWSYPFEYLEWHLGEAVTCTSIQEIVSPTLIKYCRQVGPPDITFNSYSSYLNMRYKLWQSSIIEIALPIVAFQLVWLGTLLDG